jgi:transcriptional regulator with XRE-family HTH domain
VALRAQKPILPAYPKELKSLGDHLRKRRLDLKLQQIDVGSRLGVTVCTLRNWEKNRNTPRIRHLPKIIDFLGYQPRDEGCQTLGERIIKERQRLGLSQKKLAVK